MTDSEDVLITKVLNKTSPLAKKIAHEVKSSIGTEDDAFQEMQIEQIKTIRKLEGQNKTFDDYVCICLSTLRIYRLYAFRENKRTRDSSDRSVDLAEIEEFFKSPFHSEPEQEGTEIMGRIVNRLQNADKRYSGVLQFFNEAINPSVTTLAKVEEYKKSTTCPRGLVAGEAIPPAVLAKVIGISPRRALTFKLVISKIMVHSGISEKVVKSYFDYGTLSSDEYGKSPALVNC